MTGARSRRDGWRTPCLKLSAALGQPATRPRNSRAHWRHGGVTCRDDLVRVVVDVPDTTENRSWVREFKDRWKARLEQLELWVVSYRIDIE